MRDYSKWQDSAAEEAIERLLKISQNICIDINDDLTTTHRKLDFLNYSWKSIKNILSKNKKENILDNIIKPEDNVKKLPSIDDYITSPVKSF